MNIDARIAPACQDEMREAIREAGGREVFFLGAVDDRGRLQAAEVLARGTEDAVPVVPRGAEPGAVMIHNHPGGGPLEPSGADLAIASTYASAGVGHYLVDNDVSAIYVIVEPAPPKKRVPVDLQEVSEMLGAGGALAGVLPGYELREGQLEMAEAVARALSDGGIAVVEAGTGIGKSMAYLVPALLWARANGERVVVATHTINLQEQLYGKDLPLLARALPFEVKAALVKGRTNYVCLRKLHALADENRVLPGVEDALAREVADLVRWSETSEEGGRSDLAAPPSEEVWERVQSESDTCLRLACPYFQRCFFYKSRRRAAAAEIIVANHALLFSDLSVRREMGSYKAPGVLPPFGAVVLDEAHHLEEVATRHFGKRVTRRGMLRLLGRLHRAPGKGDKGARGVFPLLREKLLIAARREGVDAEQIGALEAAMEEALLPMRDALGERIEGLSTALIELLAHVKASRDGEDARPERQLRLASWVREAAFFREHVLGLAGELVAEVRGFRDAVRAFRDRLARTPREAGEFTDALVELAAIVGRLETSASALEAALLEDRDDVVSFVEADARTRRVAVEAAPLEVGRAMREALYEPIRAVAMTSATLAVGGGFDYFAGRVGLVGRDAARAEMRVAPSPFDYDRQALVLIPSDLPDPGARAFTSMLPGWVYEALKVTAGRAFVLFTSYALLGRAYEQLAEPLRLEGIAAMRQGDEDRHRLLARFKAARAPALFGTDSFWEGVDVQGEALSSVILTKLPFKVPTEPVTQARSEYIEARGGSAFADYQLPQAALKLKQGFGRLIRSRTDRGLVWILDRRILTKPYGRVFLDTLPGGRVESGKMADLLALASAFMAGAEGAESARR